MIINSSSFKTEHQINRAELDKDNLVEMITVDDHANLIALTYKDGSDVFIKLCLNLNGHTAWGL